MNNVSFTSCFSLACAGPDYEQLQIERRLRAYGIEPTGNKFADKAKLHEIELQKVKNANSPNGGFLTISYAKEQEIIDAKKERVRGNSKKSIDNNDKNLKLKEDEILGKQILAIIELKKREQKDKIKAKEHKIGNNNSKNIKLKQKTEAIYTPKPQILPEMNNNQKETYTRTNIN